MTLSEDISITSSSLNDIKDAIISRGGVISGNIITYATAIENLSGNIVVRREVVDGKFQTLSTNFSFRLPSNIIDIGDYALSYAFYNCTLLTSIDLSSLTTISGGYALLGAFYNCTSLTTVNLSSLTTISGSNALSNSFQNCTSLTSLSFPSLTTISSSNALTNAFRDCSSLTSIDLSSLTIISSNAALYYSFQNCTSLVSIAFPSLATISGSYALLNAFQNCTSLTSLSFPALTSTSFSNHTNQFNDMLAGVTGCTVHFPSNLQSIIGSWSDVVAGFGGTNTTVLFDLSATT